jgi:hypothetical protein
MPTSAELAESIIDTNDGHGSTPLHDSNADVNIDTRGVASASDSLANAASRADTHARIDDAHDVMLDDNAALGSASNDAIDKHDSMRSMRPL